ncbi:MAG: hypothetical protein JOZ07_09200 [Solirubrobacterales bacterium]|nr:hypothetical protein [Solirubrobacterales bacterium]
MLFDLRSRGRRRTVQVVYSGLAVLFAAGLVLFGVGTGIGGGDPLSAIFGGGSSNDQSSSVSSAEKAALRQTQASPNDAGAWADLVDARWSAAEADSQQTTSGVPAFNPTGERKLAEVGQAYQRYTQLTQNPSSDVAILAAQAAVYVSQWSQAAAAWEVVAGATPDFKGYACLAITAYAAKQTRKGDLALAKALTLVPKASRQKAAQEIEAAKTSPSTAQASC